MFKKFFNWIDNVNSNSVIGHNIFALTKAVVIGGAIMAAMGFGFYLAGMPTAIAVHAGTIGIIAISALSVIITVSATIKDQMI